MIEALSEPRPASVRVVRVFSRLNIGGPAVHVLLLSAGLRPLGYDTRLVVGKESPREGNMLSLAAEKGVGCEKLNGLGREISPIRDLRAFVGLHRLFRTWKPTIVHTHTAKAGLLGRLAARLTGVPVVVHTYHGHVLRGYFSPVVTAAFRWLEARLASHADSLVAVSESVKQDWTWTTCREHCPGASFAKRSASQTRRPSLGWWGGSSRSRTCRCFFELLDSSGRAGRTCASPSWVMARSALLWRRNAGGWVSPGR
jgi:glycosyltransferase involved in cell wall biosynthesis